MATLSDLIRVGTQVLNAGSAPPWLKVLADLAAHWQDLAAALNDLPDGGTITTIKELLDFVRGKLDNAAVVAVFDTLKLPDLRTELAKVEAELAKIPAPIATLMHPVSAYTEAAAPLPEGTEPSARPPAYREDWVDHALDAGEITLPLDLFAIDETASAGAVDFTLNAAASASLSAEAGAVWPYAKDQVAGGLIELKLEGVLTAKAGASVPFQGVTASIGAEGGARGTVLFYHRPKAASTYYAVALADAITGLPNPFDLQSVWNAMRLRGFEGQIFAVDGYAGAQVDVAFGKMADIPKILSAKLNVSLQVGIKRRAAYIVSARRVALANGGLGLRVAVSHDKAAVKNWAVGANLTLDLSPVFARAHDVLDEAVGQWDQHLGQITPYLSPGTWIRTQLQAELKGVANAWIKDAALRTAVVQDLGRVLDPKMGSDSAVAGWLADAIGHRLNMVKDMVNGRIDDVTKDAMTAVTDWLPAMLHDGVRAELESRLAEWIGTYRTRLDTQLATVAGAFPTGKSLVKALDGLGLKVDGALNALDEKTAALRRFVTEFNALLHTIVDFTGDSAKQKIVMELSLSASHEKRTTMELVGTFTDNPNAQSSALFHAMMMGRLSSVQAVFDEPNKVAGFTVDGDASLLSRFRKSTRRTGFTFVGFGLELSISQLLSSEATVTRTINGDIVVLTKSELVKSASGPRESRSASFTSSYDLMLARAMDEDGAATQRALALAIVASHRDKSLKRTEVSGFMQSLSRHNLIDQSRVNAALTLYESWSDTRGSQDHRRGDIDLNFSLNADEIARLIALGRAIRAELRPGSMHDSLHVMSLAFDAMMRVERVNESILMRQIRDHRRTKSYGVDKSVPDKDWFLLLLQSARRNGGGRIARHNDVIFDFIGDTPPSRREIGIMGRAVSAALDILHLMADIYDAAPQTPANRSGWSEKDYLNHEKELAKASRFWLDLGSEWIFWFKEGLGNRTAAFFLFLIHLANGGDIAAPNRDANRHFTITMTRRDKDDTAGEAVAV